MLNTYCNSDHFTSCFLRAFDVFILDLVPPNIVGTDESQDFTVLRNRQVTLECKSDAVPPPVIAWLKNGERLQVNFAKFHSYLEEKKKKVAR